MNRSIPVAGERPRTPVGYKKCFFLPPPPLRPKNSERRRTGGGPQGPGSGPVYRARFITTSLKVSSVPDNKPSTQIRIRSPRAGCGPRIRVSEARRDPPPIRIRDPDRNHQQDPVYSSRVKARFRPAPYGCGCGLITLFFLYFLLQKNLSKKCEPPTPTLPPPNGRKKRKPTPLCFPKKPSPTFFLVKGPTGITQRKSTPKSDFFWGCPWFNSRFLPYHKQIKMTVFFFLKSRGERGEKRILNSRA